jgi:hypothetical protein
MPCIPSGGALSPMRCRCNSKGLILLFDNALMGSLLVTQVRLN